MKGGTKMAFVHLHVYSAYSLLSSTVTVENLVKHAKEKGFPAIALTDRNVMYGAISFYQACKKNAIKPIIGLTVDMKIDHEERSYPLVLLAKNNDGYQNLLKITSAVQTKSVDGIPFQWLKHYTKGLFAITPGREGIIETYLLADKQAEAHQIAKRLAESFEQDAFFLALQNDGTVEDQMLLKKMESFSKETNIKLVATNSVHYLSKDDVFAHECLLAIKNGHTLQKEQLHNVHVEGHHYLKSAREMHELFSSYEEAVENTRHIAEQCHVTMEFHKQLLPKYPVKEGMTADELLHTLCHEGLSKRYPQVTEAHYKRLSYELDTIKQMGFSDYFLIVWDFMKYAREQGILTGPGRGSAAGSIVSFVLYITHVDPLKYGLLFERFLNPERISMPDIDIDFPDHRRDEMIKYVANKYGNLHVAQIITFGTLAAKAAIRDVGRVFGLDTKELDKLSRMIPSKLGISLHGAYRESQQLRAFVAESLLNQTLFEVACQLEGLPRHTSTHAAGVVISEEPLVDVIPIQAGHGDVYLTQFSMGHLEEIGLLKMDFLGLKNLTLIESIITSIENKTGKKVDIAQIPLHDEKTYRLLSNGETSGVFQLESEGMQKVLIRLKPTRFEDIVAVNALYRPGPMENIPLYIDRKHGREKVVYPHSDLQSILENTYGVIVYQEQIMQIASKMAGFTLGEADLLRKAVSKKQADVLQKEREHFVQGALHNGYDEQVAERIYDLIVKFANYGFNRSHAVAYSMIAYQLVFLKAHYPLDFMAALLTSVIGNERRISQYIQELKERGLSVSPPSINHSKYSFLADRDKVHYSLAAIKGVGGVALREIFAARRTKRFADLFDFCMRVSAKAVNRKTIEALIHAGTFDEFGQDRAILLATLDVALEHAQLVQPVGGDNHELFHSDAFMIEPKYIQVEAMPIEDKLRFEREVLGLYLSDHPVSVYTKALDLLHAKQLNKLSMNNQRVQTGVFIADVKKIRTKKGESMAFLTISDPSLEMDAVVFPKVYRQISSLLKEGEIVFLEGRVDRRNDRKQFIVEKCEQMGQVMKEMGQTLYIKISQQAETSGKLHALKKLLKKFQGRTPVVLFYETSKRVNRLSVSHWVFMSDECRQQLNNLLGEENIILKD